MALPFFDIFDDPGAYGAIIGDIPQLTSRRSVGRQSTFPASLCLSMRNCLSSRRARMLDMYEVDL